MNVIEKLARGNCTLGVWGEPTVCDIAVCETPFIKDGSVRGHITRHYGGSAYATAIGACHMGADVKLWGPFGEDQEGQEALTYARDSGVKIENIKAGQTRKTIVITDTDGTRSMVGDAGDAFDKPYADSIASIDTNILHVSLSSIERDQTGAVLRLLERSKPDFLSIDMGSVGAIEKTGREKLERVLSLGKNTLIFANAEETEALRHALEDDFKPGWCLVSRSGSDGAHMRDSTQEWFEPVPSKITPVDTTGAGDAFAAGFLAKWMAGERNWGEILKASHRAAGETISRIGTV